MYSWPINSEKFGFNANLSDDFQSDRASFLHMKDAFNFGRDL